MKALAASFLLSVSCHHILAAQTLKEPHIKYWIFFVDKDHVGAKNDGLSGVLISDRALERRRRRATEIPTHIDLPVNTRYLDVLSDMGIEIRRTSRWLNAASAFLSRKDFERIRGLPFVVDITPVGLGTIDTSSGTTQPSIFPPAAPSSQHSLDYGASFDQLDRANVIPNLEAGINGAGVLLGIIDTGIGELNHKVFARMLADNRFYQSRDFTDSPDDGNRHARNVLSIAAGYFEGGMIGPAWRADIIHARTEYTKAETRQEEDDFVAGLEWMEAMGVDVVNVSLSYTTFDNGIGDYTYADMNGETTVTTVAADMAAALGVVVVAAAGNTAGPGCTPETCWYYIGAPADGNDVITVGAVDSLDRKANFSSFGPTADGRHKPDVSAMGKAVTYACTSSAAYPSYPDGFCPGNGTSYAAPLVAGIVAQMLQVNPGLSPSEVADILRSTARPPESGGAKWNNLPNDSLGWGIVDASAAVWASITVKSDDAPDELPETRINGPYPLPAVDHVRFDVTTSRGLQPARFELFDTLGRRVYRDEKPVAGSHAVLLFRIVGIPPGVYAFRLTTDRQARTGSMVVVR